MQALLVFTYKEGLLSRVAHDLKLRVGEFTIEWDGDSVSASFESTSISVINAMKRGRENPRALGAGDRGKIVENMRKDVLQSARYPDIRYRSTGVYAQAQSVRVEGELTLVGVTRPVQAQLRRRGARWEGRISLHQPDFRIRPFSALMGAIKVKPDVVIELSLPVQPE